VRKTSLVKGKEQKDQRRRLDQSILPIKIAHLLMISLVLISVSTIAIGTEFGFYPSGWMGDFDDISYDEKFVDPSRSDHSCIRIHYSALQTNNFGWSGIYWQYPDGNWGDEHGKNLDWAKELTFWVKGEKGGEIISFKVGGIVSDSVQPPVEKNNLKLTTQWQKISIDITKRDLTNVVGGFCWVANKKNNPNGFTIFLDEIQYE